MSRGTRGPAGRAGRGPSGRAGGGPGRGGKSCPLQLAVLMTFVVTPLIGVTALSLTACQPHPPRAPHESPRPLQTARQVAP
ncbi:MAG TPA: hypothetical protein VFC19_49130 [Candidatus Limnocylindrales bacterium]|nr:hypothetical protein [Candidatus Limnocylindrales bacterium]